MIAYFLITPAHQVPNFVHQRDREYFSKPVRVEPLYCDRQTKLIYVRDPERDCTFPCEQGNLKTESRLTGAQKCAAGLLPQKQTS